MNSIGDRTIGFEDDNEGDLTLETRPIAQDIEADTEDYGDEEGPLADELLEHIEQAEVDDINEALRTIDNIPLLKTPLRRSARERISRPEPEQTPRDSRWSRTLRDMRNMSLWGGESQRPKILVKSYLTELSRGLRAT